MKFLARILSMSKSPAGLVSAKGNDGSELGVGWLRNLFLLLAMAALVIQILCFYYDVNQRTIHNTAGMNIDRKANIIPVTDADGSLTSAAERIGIREGDRIVKLNGQPVSGVVDYRRLLNRCREGSMLKLTVQRDGETLDLLPVRVETRSLDVSVLLRHLAGLAFLVTGTLVGLVGGAKVREKRVARLFFLACICLGLYVVLMHSHVPALVFVQALALTVAPGAIIHFFLTFPQERAVAQSRWVLLLYVPGLVLMGLILLAYQDAVAAGMGLYLAPRYVLWNDKIGFGYLQLSAIFGLMMMGHVYTSTSQPIQRRQLQWIMLGLFCAIVAATVDIVLTLRGEHSTQAFRWLLLGFLPVPITFAFAILRYRLWDVDLVLNRSVVYTLVTGVLVAVYLLLVSGLSMVLGIAAGGQEYPAGSSEYMAVLFVSALLVGLLFNPLRGRIQAVIDRVFFRQQVDHQAALARWSEELGTSLRFADLARLLLQEIPERLQIDGAWLLVLDESEDSLELLSLSEEAAAEGPRPGSSGTGSRAVSQDLLADLSIPVYSAWAARLGRPGLALLLQEEGKVVPLVGGASLASEWTDDEDLDADGLDSVLVRWKEAGVGLALPLVSGGHADEGPRLERAGLVGIYLLGHKLSGDVYQRREIEFLRTLSNQAAISIANSRLYEQLNGLSQELELKVQERTKELRDFVSAVYHELSTPITSIRGYTDLMVDKAGRGQPVGEYPADYAQPAPQPTPAGLSSKYIGYLKIIQRSVGRLMQLVGDLSDVSKIEDGRLTIHPEILDLRQVVSETLGSLAGIIDEKGLQVTTSIPSDIRRVQGDLYRVVQILTNLVSNACRYTPAGGRIVIAARRIDGVASLDDDASLASETPAVGPATGWVEVTVTDTGIGIHKDDLERIFERFYRSEDPLVQEQSGTGLGLSITKSLVELHGSHLWVNSAVGKGSTFGFALPLVPGSARARPRHGHVKRQGSAAVGARAEGTRPEGQMAESLAGEGAHGD